MPEAPSGLDIKPLHPTILKIPPGKLEAPKPFHDGIRKVPIDEVNNVRVVSLPYIDGRSRPCEQVVQINNGDCVLASFLNTVAIEQTYQSETAQGAPPMTVVEARSYAMKLRTLMINPTAYPDSDYLFQGLPDGDIINLYSSIYQGSEFPNPRSANYIRVDGSKLSPSEAEQDAKDLLDILDDRDTYPSGLMEVGAQRHSQVIKRLTDGKYLLIDPANHDHIDAKKFTAPGNREEYQKATSILTVFEKPAMVTYLGNLIKGDPYASAYLIQHPKGAKLNSL